MISAVVLLVWPVGNILSGNRLDPNFVTINFLLSATALVIENAIKYSQRHQQDAMTDILQRVLEISKKADATQNDLLTIAKADRIALAKTLELVQDHNERYAIKRKRSTRKSDRRT